MSVNINLVDNTNSDALKREKTKKLRAVSFGVLFITAFLAVLIFTIDYRFSASYVKKQEADLLRQLEPLSETSAKLFIANSKLGDIDQILGKRTNFSEKVNKIAEGNKGDIEVEELVINNEGAELKISSASLFSIDEYLNYLVELVEKEEFSSILLNKLQSDDTGYSVEITII